MKTDREILFAYFKYNGRTSCDCGDLYNWLLDIDPQIAEKFKKKWDGAVNDIKKKEKIK